MTHDHDAHGDPERWTADFWDERYGAQDALWSGAVNANVRAEAAGLIPGTVLDVGCGEGGDALWFAGQGWTVVGTDVSAVALARAEQHARGAGLGERIRWQQADLLTGPPPAGPFDLVSAAFFHIPPTVRTAVYRSLAGEVALGGTLLVVAHDPSDHGASIGRPHDPALFFTARDLAADVLDETWDLDVCEARARTVTDADGHELQLHDTVLRARRSS